MEYPASSVNRKHNGAAAGDFVLVTAIKNEASTIAVTIDSVVHQSVLPKEWVIVNDGSTDTTGHIIATAAATYPWISIVSLPRRMEHCFARKVTAIKAGLRSLTCNQYEFIGILDGDIQLPPDYFEMVVNAFANNRRLGIAGGLVLDQGEKVSRSSVNCLNVSGAVQFFRRSCYETIGGLIAIPEGGEDTVACVQARMHGYDTRVLSTLVVHHLKCRNSAFGGFIRRNWQLGIREYAEGYHPVFELLKCCRLSLKKPFLLSALIRWLGYCYKYIQGAAPSAPPEVVSFLRQEQLRRLQFWIYMRRRY